MPKARRVLTYNGGVLTTEYHEDACCDSGEVAAVEINVPYGTVCDICGEVIEDAMEDAEDVMEDEED